MPLPSPLRDCLTIPALAVPAAEFPGPDPVVELCRGGVAGTLAALDYDSSGEFEESVSHVQLTLTERDAPFCVRLIAHASNPRSTEELAICIEHRVPLVITELGVDGDLVERIHRAGGFVFSSVTCAREVEVARRLGVDGVVFRDRGPEGAVNPFALVPELRRGFAGALVLAGDIRDGRGVAAAQVLGADLAMIDAAIPTQAWCERLEREYRDVLATTSPREATAPPKGGAVAARRR